MFAETRVRTGRAFIEKNGQVVVGVGTSANLMLRTCRQYILARFGTLPEFIRVFSTDTTSQSDVHGLPPLPVEEFLRVHSRDLGRLLAAENDRRKRSGLPCVRLSGGAHGEGAGGIAILAALMLAYLFAEARRALIALLAPFAKAALPELAGRCNQVFGDHGIRVLHDAAKVDVWWVNSAPGGTSGSWMIWQSLMHEVATELGIRVEIHEIDLLAAIGTGGDAAAKHMLVNVMRTLTSHQANFESGTFEFSALGMTTRCDKVLTATRSLVEPPPGDLARTIRQVGALLGRLVTGTEGVKFLQSAVDAVCGPLSRRGEGHGQPLLYSAIGASELWAAPPNWREFGSGHLLATVYEHEVAAAAGAAGTADAFCTRVGVRPEDVDRAAPALSPPVVPAQLPASQVERSIEEIQRRLHRDGDQAGHDSRNRLAASLTGIDDAIGTCLQTVQSAGTAVVAATATAIAATLAEAMTLAQSRMNQCIQGAQQIVPRNAALGVRIAALVAVQQNRARAAFFRDAQQLLEDARGRVAVVAEHWARRVRQLHERRQGFRERALRARQAGVPALLVHSHEDIAVALERNVVPGKLADLRRLLAEVPSTTELPEVLAAWEAEAVSTGLASLARMTTIGDALRGLSPDARVTHLRRWTTAAEPTLRIDMLTPAEESSYYTITDLPEDLHAALSSVPNRPCPASDDAPCAFMLQVRHGLAPTSLLAAREAWAAYYELLASHDRGTPIWVDPDFPSPDLVVPDADTRRLLLLPLVSRVDGGPVQLVDGAWKWVNGQESVPLRARSLSAVPGVLGASAGRLKGLPTRDEVLEQARARLEEGPPADRIALLEHLLAIIDQLDRQQLPSGDVRYLRDARLAANALLDAAREDLKRIALFGPNIHAA